MTPSAFFLSIPLTLTSASWADATSSLRLRLDLPRGLRRYVKQLQSCKRQQASEPRSVSHAPRRVEPHVHVHVHAHVVHAHRA